MGLGVSRKYPNIDSTSGVWRYRPNELQPSQLTQAVLALNAGSKASKQGDAILDVQHAFEGSPETFRRIAARHGATLLLICPNMAESTVYRARAHGGFYDRLAHGETFPWLKPLSLPAKDPLRLFQIES